MQQDVQPLFRVRHVPQALRHCLRTCPMLLCALLLVGCGGEDSAPPSMAAQQKASSAPRPIAAPSRSSAGEELTPSTMKDETAVPSVHSASMVQLSALPHLSSLSDREKAGLLMLLPSKSSSQRLALINMYPSLVKLPEQQKELLLARLEKIVPVTVSEHP